MATCIDEFFDDRIRNAFSHSDYVLTERYFRWRESGLPQQMEIERVAQIITNCFAFYSAFMPLIEWWPHELAKLPRYNKWPRYEVLELLNDSEHGVYGFNVHFSNGHKATFTRTSDGVQAMNLFAEKDGSVNFFVGPLNDMESVWKIDGKEVIDWETINRKS